MSEAIETLAPEEMLTQEEIEEQLPKPVGLQGACRVTTSRRDVRGYRTG